MNISTYFSQITSSKYVSHTTYFETYCYDYLTYITRITTFALKCPICILSVSRREEHKNCVHQPLFPVSCSVGPLKGAKPEPAPQTTVSGWANRSLPQNIWGCATGGLLICAVPQVWESAKNCLPECYSSVGPRNSGPPGLHSQTSRCETWSVGHWLCA